MSEERIELTIKTTPKGLQELLIRMPSLATELSSAVDVQPEDGGVASAVVVESDPE